MSFIPYGKQTINQDDIDAVLEVLSSDFLTTGPKIKEFEHMIAQFCGAQYCVAVSSATAALHLASLCLIKKGDKVLTTPNSFLSTANSILYAEAIPVFIDISSNGNIDLELVEDKLKEDKTIKALYAVSFSGNMLDQNKLAYLKEAYNIIILEDNSHTIGASFDNIKAGNCYASDASVFSFHPVKNLTTGEGGAITTNSLEMYEKLCSLRSHGMVKTTEMKPWEYEMCNLGYNYRITDISCALGISQLRKLPEFIQKRREIAKRYNDFFHGTAITPLYSYNNESAYHLYVVLIDFAKISITREQLFNVLKQEGIGVQLHYIAINKQPYYHGLGYGNEHTPVMDKYYKKAFSLPIYPSLTTEQQIYVIKNLIAIVDE